MYVVGFLTNSYCSNIFAYPANGSFINSTTQVLVCDSDTNCYTRRGVKYLTSFFRLHWSRKYSVARFISRRCRTSYIMSFSPSFSAPSITREKDYFSDSTHFLIHDNLIGGRFSIVSHVPIPYDLYLSRRIWIGENSGSFGAPVCLGQVWPLFLSELLVGLDNRSPSRIYLRLHFFQSLIQCLVAPNQGFPRQAISPTYLSPLKNSKNGIDEQENYTNHLKNEFGVFTPLMGVLIGCIEIVRVLWRIWWCSNWRQLGYGVRWS